MQDFGHSTFFIFRGFIHNNVKEGARGYMNNDLLVVQDFVHQPYDTLKTTQKLRNLLAHIGNTASVARGPFCRIVFHYLAYSHCQDIGVIERCPPQLNSSGSTPFTPQNQTALRCRPGSAGAVGGFFESAGNTEGQLAPFEEEIRGAGDKNVPCS